MTEQAINMPRPAEPARSVSLQQLLGDAAVPALEVCGLQCDSRRIRPGEVFCAYPGTQQDGRAHIADAVAAGAVAVLCEPPLPAMPLPAIAEGASMPLIAIPQLAQRLGEIAARFYGQPSAKMTVYGVTGTNGKTTVAQWLGQLLQHTGGACGVIGTLGAQLYSGPNPGEQHDATSDAASAGSSLTTPDAIQLQRQLAQWQAQGVKQVTLEVSSHALVQGRVNALQLDCAIFTNLSHDHLDYHGSMAAYAEAKSRLFRMPGLRSAVLNVDDPYAAQMRAALAPEVPFIGVSTAHDSAGSAAAEVRVSLLQREDGGERLLLQTPWGDGECSVRLVGAFNRANLGAVAAAALSLGAPFSEVLAILPRLQPVAGRMQLLPNSLGLRVVVDFAHTPDALEQVLRTLRAETQGELHVVFGCGGDRDRGKRAPMGAVATKLADRVYLTSDNPRGEDPQSILDQIAAGCSGPVWRHADRAVAIAHAIDSAQAGDCVLIAGKGHERTQQIGARCLPFSDAEHGARALRAREAAQ